MSSKCEKPASVHLQPVPLPYLTAIFKTHILDYTSTYHYIFGNIVVAGLAESLAHAKHLLAQDVFFSGASAQVKKDLFSIPLDSFFDTCIKEFTGKGLHLGTAEETVTDIEVCENLVGDWVQKCASHPDADIDESLKPLLSRYDFSLEHRRSLCRKLASNYKMQECSPYFFPDMRNILRSVAIHLFFAQQPKLTRKDVVTIIRQFIQLAMNAVDVWCLHEGTNPANQDRRKSILAEGSVTMEWAWVNMLAAPFSGISEDAKNVLEGSNIVENIQYVLQDAVKSHVRAGVESRHLHYVVYAQVVSAAAEERVWGSLDEVVAAIRNEFEMVVSSIPEFYRPKGTKDEITAELEAGLYRYYNLGPQDDVPIEPVGPRIDPLLYVCLNDLNESGDVLKLDACKHLIYLDCLDALMNHVTPGKNGVHCPNSRTRLCDVRDYKATLAHG
ncbi:hypothetical protein FB567DRAFT_576249 [Paraphoma chrysanthemicola]|uniref:Uncharacterized protein n=1 Tax=Paraphoma chrysanthemicola TaxID=798071 RepID=A0A8K0RFU3_9PLEO|nr:hypothetical protein FB567DRAFT_576249 [Paraphoma chrysanthemicola]